MVLFYRIELIGKFLYNKYDLESMKTILYPVFLLMVSISYQDRDTP